MYGVVIGPGDTDAGLVGPLEELGHEVSGPVRPLLVDDGVEGVDPLLGLHRIGVRHLMDVFVAEGSARIAWHGTNPS